MAPKYILTGRGGAGNTHRMAPSPSSSQTQPRRSPSSPSAAPRYVSSGVGGAGNIRTLEPSASAAAIARDVKDDISRAAARDRAPVGYAGRGGAGNAYSYRDDAASDMSGSSVGSKAKLWLSKTLSRD